MSISFLYWGAKLDTVLQTQSCKCQIESKDCLPGPAALCSTCCPLRLPDPFLQSCFLNSPKPVLMQDITPFTPRCNGSSWLLLLNFMWFLSAYFYSLSRFLWIAALLSRILTAPPVWCWAQTSQEHTLSPHLGHQRRHWSQHWFPMGHPVVASQYLDFADHSSLILAVFHL